MDSPRLSYVNKDLANTERKKMKTKFKKDSNFGSRKISCGWTLMLLVFITVFIVGECVWNAMDLQKVLGDSTELYVSDITTKVTESIRDTIEYKKADLINVADSIANVEGLSNEEEAINFMQRKAKILGFDALALLDRNGEYVLAAEEEMEWGVSSKEILDMPEVQEAFQGVSGIGYFGDQMLLYSAPVRAEQEIAYVLVGIRSKENMQSLIASESFKGKCLNCIVGGDGQMVCAPTDLKPFIQLEDIFEVGSEQVRTDIMEMEENLVKGKPGIFKFTSIDGKRNYLSYNPLNVNDWTVMTIVPANLISAGSDKFILRSFVLIGGIFLTLAIFWLIVYRIYNESRKQLWDMAFVDPVTGGMNNMAFLVKYREMAETQSMGEYAIVLMDVRDFKMVNENFGVTAGNEMLRYIYRVLDGHMRKEDQEFVTRSESDRYFLCIRASKPEAVQARMDEIIADINSFRNVETPHYQLTFKLGVCLVKNQKLDITVLEDRARIASQKKQQGVQTGCVFYDKSIAEKIKREQELDALFDTSLENHDFQVYLQPKVGIEDGKLKGAEALVRWKHPGKGMISPGEFIPLFENNGKICRLDLYMFEEICRMLSRWQKEGRTLWPVSVNLSRCHFYGKNFLSRFYEIYEKYDLPPYIIEFELTESIFLTDDQLGGVKEGIRQMHHMGFRCSLDDFGSGYSSLGLLREFDVDTVKLDRCFFLDISSEKAKDVILCLVELAKRLKVKTVAEGIEEPEQLEYLRSIHCDEVQGYIYSRPLPISEFEHFEPEAKK